MTITMAFFLMSMVSLAIFCFLFIAISVDQDDALKGFFTAIVIAVIPWLFWFLGVWHQQIVNVG